MAKNHRELDASNETHQQAASRTSYVTMAFNIGLALFLLEGFWQLLHGPFETSIEHRLHTVVFYTGLGLAAVLWIISSRNARWLNGALTLAVFAGVFYAGFDSLRRFDASQRELMRGTLVNGRVVYSELGLSFAAPPDWQMNLQPFIQKGKSKALSGTNTTRVRYGETAVYFQAAPQATPSSHATIADSIQVEGGPFLFRSLGRTLGSVRKIESSYKMMTGVKVVQPTRFYELENMDFAEFEVLDETQPQHVLYRHVFARSGHNRLDFVLSTSGDQAPPRFGEFTRSIRITREPTRFND